MKTQTQTSEIRKQVQMKTWIVYNDRHEWVGRCMMLHQANKIDLVNKSIIAEKFFQNKHRTD